MKVSKYSLAHEKEEEQFFSPSHLPAEILLGLNEDIFSGKTKDCCLIKFPNVSTAL